MKYTNINILDGDKRFKYILEYIDDVADVESSVGYMENINSNDLRVDFVGIKDDKWVGFFRDDNTWLKSYGNASELFTDYIPSKYNISSVNLYFPTNSVESFDNNNLYALTVNTWIHGHIVYLGSYLIDRRDALACGREKKFLNRNYYEYVNVKFIDPWYLTYSDEWKEFRQEVCGEVKGESEQNNTGAELNFTLYPVVLSEGSEDTYIKLDPYIGGQNAINIAKNTKDYIGCDVVETTGENGEMIIKASLHFNDSYTQDMAGLRQYMKETYDIDSNADRMVFVDYDLLIVDDENIYKTVNKKVENNDLSCVFTRDDISFDSWSGFKDGLRLLVNANIYTESGTVDLGLSIRWARYNLGAYVESQTGDKYAWGELETKDHYDWSNYRFGSDKRNLSKYNATDDKLVLDLEDDIVYKTFGSNWRMPTDPEFKELIRNTNYEWVTIGGVEGWKFNSKVSDNYIFIPFGTLHSATRYRHPSVIDYCVWYDNYFVGDKSEAASIDRPSMYSVDRAIGRNIRAIRVLSENEKSEDLDYREDIMLLRSNSIPMTMENIKYFVSIGDAPKYINLDNINMNNYTINAVNKIEKKIIQVEKPNDGKANIIKPVYYKVHDLKSIVVHPAVTENICINLDAYKATTDTFYIQIEGTVFVESARISSGVVFKVIGSNLPGEVGEGTYYILNADKELITTGKYTYES